MLGRLDPSNLKRALGEWFDGRLARATFAGGDLPVMQNGQELCRIAGGVADARTGRRVGRKAMYRLDSMTKPVTGPAALIPDREDEKAGKGGKRTEISGEDAGFGAETGRMAS